MPHVIVEYSANLEEELRPQALVDALHQAALKTGVMPIGGLRTRAERRDIYRVADGDPSNAFVAVLVRIGEGRDEETRRGIAETLMRALEAETQDVFARRGLGLTVEVQQIDGTASVKTNNLHEHVKARAAGGALP